MFSGHYFNNHYHATLVKANKVQTPLTLNANLSYWPNIKIRIVKKLRSIYYIFVMVYLIHEYIIKYEKHRNVYR